MESVKFRAGYWMLRVVRGGPFVAARIWICNHEPGEPNNIMDRPYWQGQIGLDLTPPGVVWSAVEFVESSPEQQAMLVNPPLSDRAPRNGRAAAYRWAPLAKWKQERAKRIPAHAYDREIQWLSWASRNKPDHPDYTYRKAVDLKAVPVPKWADRERFA